MGRHRVRQPAGFIDAGQRRQDLWRHFLVQFYVLLELRNDGSHQHVDFALIVPIFFVQDRDIGREMIADIDAVDRRAFGAFDEDFDGAIGQLQELQDRRQRANVIKVLGLRIVEIGLLLCNQEDFLAGVHGAVQCDDGLLAPDEQRDHHVRIHDNVAQRQHGRAAQLVRLVFANF